MEALSLRGYSILILVLTLSLSGIASADVVINEMLPHAASDWYKNGEVGDMNDEFIELYNSGDEAAEISGYTLTDTSYRRSPGLYTFPEGTTIPARGFIVVYSVESGVFQGDSGDSIKLNDSSGNTIDEKGYEKALGGDVSLARIPDGNDWNVSSLPTPGEANRQVAMVRAVHLSPDEDDIEFSINELPVIELEFGEASAYQKVVPGTSRVRAADPEDESSPLELDLFLGAETKTSLILTDLTSPLVVEDAAGIPEVKTAWLRFVNLATEPVDLTLPEGGKIWFGGEKAEVEAGGYLFDGVASQEVTDYVAAYSGELKVLVSPDLEETLDLGDEGVYTLALTEDQKTSEKKLVLLEERFEEE
jgi:hypothetical protein